MTAQAELSLSADFVRIRGVRQNPGAPLRWLARPSALR